MLVVGYVSVCDLLYFQSDGKLTTSVNTSQTQIIVALNTVRAGEEKIIAVDVLRG